MSILSRERIVADASYNRWLVPPAALLIHLSIGMIYGFSVFWPAKGKGLLTLIGSQCDAMNTSLYDRLFITSCDWFLSDVVWTFSIAIVCLGLSAAVMVIGWSELDQEKPGLLQLYYGEVGLSFHPSVWHHISYG